MHAHGRRLALALAFALGGGAAFAQQAPGRAQAAPPQTAAEDRPYWILEEFDWGDDEEVVGESVLFDPHFSCNGTQTNPCILVSTYVEREQLLVTFQHHEGKLWQIVVLTPDLDLVRANAHIPRIWQVLVDYVTRLKGEPLLAVPIPELASLAIGPPQPTHFWSLDDVAVRILVGRRDEDLLYVAASFSDPALDQIARPAYEAALAKSDERKRQTRAAEKAAKQQGAKP